MNLESNVSKEQGLEPRAVKFQEQSHWSAVQLTWGYSHYLTLVPVCGMGQDGGRQGGP